MGEAQELEMSLCKKATIIVFAPLIFGCLLGVAIGNSLIVALEDARRQRREEAVTRETAWLIWDSHERGPVIETVYDGGEIGVN